ncbi:MAG: ATP synthase F1 subunit epsilon [Rhodospirillales bacterium]|jgi:F-type H+-transporting ATPase subunit epsilon|nr:ATP synthase F1 subunit epsilon [Rhodospirillaceae bacterium]MDP6643237.1 ATP synthase F1 subunit epsilon [Rhodospirillales bacterium]MDP6840909.1 ATP synthase F1 subunit epsilon [Rhodospirillales bacterium]|tara:strand:- start:2472 stop:2900 length:429 start_codon:yes stop_codon:yes gene_type:complete
MMADSGIGKVAFDLVTPTELAVSEEADMVVVPGAEGDFGVLPGHTPLLTTLRAGLIDIHQDGAIEQSLFVESGFAEATPERCTVLAGGVTPMNEISAEDARARLAAAEEAYRAAEDDARAAAETELRTAEAMIKAVEMRAGG